VRELLRRLVALPSPSGQEAALIDALVDELRGLGLNPLRYGDNLLCPVGEGPPRLLLLSHVDTVPPCEGWSGDPWAPRWEGDRLQGLGANDAKGCVVALVHGALRARAQGWPGPGSVLLALVAQEEVGGPGGLAALLPHLPPLAGAVVGEPTGNQPVTAQRGMLLLRCTARGTSGHVAHGTASGADNAIHRAARDIGRLAALRWPPHPRLGETRAQVTTVTGGLQRNQIPDRCEFFVDLRTAPPQDHAALTAQVAALLESEVHLHSERYLPKATPPGSAIERAALRACGLSEGLASATVSDWAFLGDLPAVKLGPGDSLRSHRPNEYLLAAELERGAAVYAATIRAFFEECAGER